MSDQDMPGLASPLLAPSDTLGGNLAPTLVLPSDTVPSDILGQKSLSTLGAARDIILGESLLKRLLIVLVIYQSVALGGIILWSIFSWAKPDVVIIWVPQAVIEWSLIGAVAGALYRLSNYPKLTDQEKASLYLWVLAKPFVSTALGCIIYFIFVGGLVALTSNSAVAHPESFSAIAFFAAFSDRFAISVLDRLSLSKPGGEG